MTTTQWNIYNYIKEHGVVNSIELCEQLNFAIDEDSEKRNLSRKSLDLYKEIEQINASYNIEKIIIWDTKSNYWLARNEDEVKKFVNRIYRSQALKKLSKMYLLLNKSKRNGQGKLFSNELKPIDDKSRARAFVETFVDDLTIDERIAELERENEEIEYDDKKYINGRYEKQQRNLEEIDRLKKGKKENGKSNVDI